MKLEKSSTIIEILLTIKYQYFLTILMLALLLFTTNKVRAEVDYIFKESKISEQHREKYTRLKNAIDSWVENEKPLIDARKLLNEMTQEIPSFFPLKIERARLIMIQGAQDKKPINVYYGEALEYLKQVQQEAPYFAPTYSLLGHVYTLLNETELAKEALDKSFSLGFRDSWLFLNYATYYARINEPDKMLDNAIHALSRPRQSEKSSSFAVSLLLEGSKYTGDELDIGYLYSLIFNTIESPERIISLAENIVHRHSRDKQLMQLAFNMIEKVLASNKKNEDALFVKAEWYFENSWRYASSYCTSRPEWIEKVSVPLYQELTNSEKFKYKAFERLFHFAVTKKNLKNAYELAEKFANNDKFERKYIMLHGHFLMCMGEHQKLVDLIDRSSKKIPNLLDERLYADAQNLLGNHSVLNDYYVKRLEIQPNDAYLHGNYAYFVAMYLRDFDKGIEHFKKGMAIKRYGLMKKHFSLLLLFRLSEEYKSGQIKEARKHYDDILYYDLRDYIERKNCFGGCGKYQASLDYFDKENRSVFVLITKVKNTLLEMNSAELLLSWYLAFVVLFFFYMIFNSLSLKSNLVFLVFTLILGFLLMYAAKEIIRRYTGENNYSYFLLGLAPVLGAILGRLSQKLFWTTKVPKESTKR